MNDKMTTFDFTLNYKQIDFDIIMELLLRTTASGRQGTLDTLPIVA